MRLQDVDESTEITFLHCLHDERPDDPRAMGVRRKWYREHVGSGLVAKVLVLDSGEVAGLVQCLPIEQTSLVGRGLLSVLCMWVHGYDHHIGNKQGNGYGRYMLERIEAYARESGFAGVSAWGMDFPYWNPVSFYEHMGYERCDKAGEAVLVWKKFASGAEPPAFRRRLKAPIVRPDKVSVAVFYDGSCMSSCEQCFTVRDGTDGLGALVDYMEVDTSDPDVLAEWGIPQGTFVEGRPHRPYEPPFTSEVLRNDILELARAKGLDSGPSSRSGLGRGVED